MNGEQTGRRGLTRAAMAAALVLCLVVLAGAAGAAEGPRIAVPDPLYSFGTVTAGTVLEHVFEIRNTGDGVLEIKKVAPS